MSPGTARLAASFEVDSSGQRSQWHGDLVDEVSTIDVAPGTDPDDLATTYTFESFADSVVTAGDVEIAPEY